MVRQVIGTAADPTALFPGSCAAKGLGPERRKRLAVAALAGGKPVSRLAADQGVSRKFVYQQARKADEALDETFAVEPDDEQVLYHLPVTKKWIGQLVLAQALGRAQQLPGDHSDHRQGDRLRQVVDRHGA